MYLEKDSDGLIGVFAVYQPGWSPASQDKIKAYVLRLAKTQKTSDLKEALAAFRDLGFVDLNDWIFNLSEGSAQYAKTKYDLSLGGDKKFWFYDIGYLPRDFSSVTAFFTFVDALCAEEERLMEKYNDYRMQIKFAGNMATLNAITITFNA